MSHEIYFRLSVKSSKDIYKVTEALKNIQGVEDVTRLDQASQDKPIILRHRGESLEVVHLPEGLTYGKYLKSLRESNGLSVQDLADIISLDRTTITQYETGSLKPPRLNNFEMLIEGLNPTEAEITVLKHLSGRFPKTPEIQIEKGNNPL